MSDSTPPRLEGPLCCPNCGGALEATPAEQPQVVTCPYCNQPFVLPGADGSTLAVARPAAPEAAEDQPFVVVDSITAEDQRAVDELDAYHVRKVTKLRRSAYRGRSFLLIGALVCVAGALQLGVNALYVFHRAGGAIRVERREFGTWPAGFLMVGMILLAVGYRFFMRAAELKREAERSALSEPTTPPDLSQLGDGSERARRLEEIEDR
jgi:hypothetical protein